MQIGIIGAGNIGSALATHFHKLGHPVEIANSRGPETLSNVALATGAVPVALSEVAKGKHLLVVSVPLRAIPALSGHLAHLPASAIVVDTGNYYPVRDGVIADIEAGLTESEWTAKLLGRPVIKVFNNIVTGSLVHGGLPADAPNRIALPVAGDDSTGKQLVIGLLDQFGFDGVDAGPLSESWRQQPGSPVYGTNYDADTVRRYLASVDRPTVQQMQKVLMERFVSLPANITAEQIVQAARALWATSAFAAAR